MFLESYTLRDLAAPRPMLFCVVLCPHKTCCPKELGRDGHAAFSFVNVPASWNKVIHKNIVMEEKLPIYTTHNGYVKL